MTLIENKFFKTMKIGIIGLGFVGLSFASVLGSKKYSVIGVDSDKQKINKILTGKAPFYEPKLDSTLKNALKNFNKVDIIINLASSTDAESSLKKPNEMYRNNLGIFQNVLKYCKKNSQIKMIFLNDNKEGIYLKK